MSVQRKKQWEIHKASKRSKDIKGIFAGGKRMKFGSSGAFITDDPGVARDVDQKYGKYGSGDAIVVEVDDSDKTHENRGGRRSRKVFTMPKMPWKK